MSNVGNGNGDGNCYARIGGNFQFENKMSIPVDVQTETGRVIVQFPALLLIGNTLVII